MVRTRLFERLDQQHPVTLVRGPAGFGKRTLLQLWVETRGDVRTDTVWVPSPPGRRTAVDFWRDVAHALEPVARLRPREAASAAAVRALLSQRAESVTLVLDRFDAIAAEVVTAELLDLVRTVPGLSVVVSARTRLDLSLSDAPPDPVDALARHARVVEGAELLMTAPEAMELFAALGLGRDAARVEELHASVGGWPALVRELAAAIAAARCSATCRRRRSTSCAPWPCRTGSPPRPPRPCWRSRRARRRGCWAAWRGRAWCRRATTRASTSMPGR
jgi:LuxR family maltose regulon positive regulatory protein